MSRIRLTPFWRVVLACSRWMAFASVFSLLAMMLVICADIAMRRLGHPLKGSYDCVKILGVLSVSCALPLTTALKGHVAIEYFFQRLNRGGRLAVDTLMRLAMSAGFGLAMAECVRRGLRFLRNGEVTQTIELPIFWVPWVMALSLGVTLLVVLFHLAHPGHSLGKP